MQAPKWHHLLEGEAGRSVVTGAPLWVAQSRQGLPCGSCHPAAVLRRMSGAVPLLVSQERPTSLMALVGTLAPQLANMAVCYVFLSWVNRRSRRSGGSAARQVRLRCIAATCFSAPRSHPAHAAAASQPQTSRGAGCARCTRPGQRAFSTKCARPGHLPIHATTSRMRPRQAAHASDARPASHGWRCLLRRRSTC